MAETEVNGVSVRIRGDVSPLESAVQQAEKLLGDFGKTVVTLADSAAAAFGGVQESVSALAEGMGGLAAAAVPLAGALAAVSGAAVGLEAGLVQSNLAAVSLRGSLSAAMEAAGGLRSGIGGLTRPLQDVLDAEFRVAQETNLLGSSMGSALVKADEFGSGIGALRRPFQEIIDAEFRVIEETNLMRRTLAEPVRVPPVEGGLNPAQGRRGFGNLAMGLQMIGGQLESTVTQPLIRVAKESEKTASAFDKAVHALYATAGADARKNPFASMKDDLLALAVETRAKPVDLAKNLYGIYSLGYQGAQGIEVLRNAQRLARGTTGDLNTSAAILGKTLTSYNMTAKDSSRLTDLFTKAVKTANSTGKEFAPAWGTVLDTGRNLGVSLQSQAAFLSTLTRTVKSPQVGATYLRAFEAGLSKPPAAAAKFAKSVGLDYLAEGKTYQKIKADSGNIGGVFKDILRVTDGAKPDLLAKLFPDMRKQGALLSGLRDGMRDYIGSFKELANSAGSAHAANEEMNKSLDGTKAALAAKWDAALIKLFDSLSPIFLRVVDGLMTAVNWFNKLSPSMRDNVVAVGLFAAAAGPVISTLGGIGIAVSLIGPAVVGVTAAITVLGGVFAANVGGIRTATVNALGGLGTYLKGQFAPVAAWFQENLPLMRKTVQTVLAEMAGFWRDHGQEILAIIRPLWQIVETIVGGGLRIIGGILKAGMQAITGDWVGAWHTLVDTAGRAFNDLASILHHLAEAVWNALKAVISTLLGFGARVWDIASDIGSKITDGIVGGIKRGAGAVSAAAKNLAGSAVSAVKAHLEIHSPSQVMFHLGVLTSAGLAAGILAYLPTVSRAATTLAETAHSSVAKHHKAQKGRKPPKSEYQKESEAYTRETRQLTREEAALAAGDTSAEARAAGKYNRLGGGRQAAMGGLREKVRELRTFVGEVKRLRQQIASESEEEAGRAAIRYGMLTPAQRERIVSLRNEKSAITERNREARAAEKLDSDRSNTLNDLIANERAKTLGLLAARKLSTAETERERLSLKSLQVDYSALTKTQQQQVDVLVKLTAANKATSDQDKAAEKKATHLANLRKQLEALTSRARANLDQAKGTAPEGGARAERYQDRFAELGAAAVKEALNDARMLAQAKTLAAATKEATREEKKSEEVTDKLKKGISELSLRYQEATGQMDDYQKAILRLNLDTSKLTETQKRQVDEYFHLEQQVAMVEKAHEIAGRLTDTFVNSLTKARNSAKGIFTDIALSFAQMLQEMAKDYLASTVKGFLSGLIGQAFAGGGSGGGGAVLAAGGAGTSYDVSAPGRVAGGSVLAGQAYTVGERGRELFLPSVSGTIVPAAQTSALLTSSSPGSDNAGVGDTHIHFHVSTPDVGGFRASQQQLMQDAYTQSQFYSKRNG